MSKKIWENSKIQVLQIILTHTLILLMKNNKLFNQSPTVLKKWNKANLHPHPKQENN
jgi:hypothetical protein